jgi:agmatinase
MTEAYRDLLRRPSKTQPKPKSAVAQDVKGKDGVYHPRLITLGGDHSVALPALRALNEIYGPVSVLHFDSHLDTWNPSNLAGAWSSEQSDYTHGSMVRFVRAHEATARSIDKLCSSGLLVRKA